jgi:fatty-acyl-CoA synthase
MSVSNTALTPLSFLERSARVLPNKTAVIYGTRRMTYREVAAEATRMAHALRASGIEPGDRVAYLMPNLPEMLVAQFAVPLAGGVLVSVNTRLSDEEIAYILNHSGAKVLVTDSAFLPQVASAIHNASAITEVVVFEDAEAGEAADPRAVQLAGARLVRYGDFTLRGSNDPLEWAVDDELAPISINYTSGTTGRPKGVVYTHRGAYLNCFGEIVHSSFDQDSVYLWTLPMFHCNGWCTQWALTGIGGTHVCLREVRGDVIWDLIQEHRVTHLNGAPTVVTTIMNAPRASKLDYSLLITTAGAPPSPTTILQMDRELWPLLGLPVPA